MLKNDYLKVSILDIIRCFIKAKDNQEDPCVINVLSDLFVNAECSEVIISKNSPEGMCILKYYPTITSQNCITLESLSLAFCRLYFGKNNKELLKRIEKYYRQFYENLKYKEDNTILKQEIILDDEAFQLIKQFSNYDDYETSIVEKRKVIQLEKANLKPKQDLRGKAIID